MVNSINSDVSSLQILRATQAFKKAIQSSQKVNSVLDENQTHEIEDKVSITSRNSEINSLNPVKQNNRISDTNRVSLNEIKLFAGKHASEITDEDVKYALRYGRSILVDCSA